MIPRINIIIKVTKNLVTYSAPNVNNNNPVIIFQKRYFPTCNSLIIFHVYWSPAFLVEVFASKPLVPHEISLILDKA